VTNVMRCKGASQFQRAGPDDQIRERHRYSFYRLLATDAGDDLRRGCGDRVDRDMLLKFIEEPAPLLRLRLFARVIDAVTQLGNGQSADNDRNISRSLLQVPDHFGRSKLASLRPHQNTGIDDEAPD